ncbi:MAG: DHH family phosphoesterase [Terracidiphilus sp.]
MRVGAQKLSASSPAGASCPAQEQRADPALETGRTGILQSEQFLMERILQILRQGERFLVCSHSRPDGDAVGSMLAMGILLDQMGKHADLVAADRVPGVYRGLPGSERIRTSRHAGGLYDAVIVLECDGLERTGIDGLDPYFLVNIDHHASGREFAQLNWINRQTASVGELVYRLAKSAGVRVTPELATCIYATLLTDTGCFCHGFTRASTFGLAQELVEAGADPVCIAQKVYFSMPVSKLLLLGVALGNLKQEGKLVWLWVTLEDMERTAATEEDCEGIVNYALCAGGVEAAVFLWELPGGGVRLSLRSKGRVDVAALAERMGGGGHENAAGYLRHGTLAGARDEILTELRLLVAALASKDG